MKKLLIILLTVMTTLTMNAERVSKQEALMKAQQFMPNKQFGEAKTFARGEKADSPAEYDAFYIFNAGNKGGFVIVSGDDRTEPILGYSDRGSLNPDSVPENVKGLLNYYEKVLTVIANDKNYTRPARTRGAEERKTVEPLLCTEWGQGQTGALYQPFNMKCPIVNGKWTVTGCVATAMAQIINYHQWPKNETSAVPAYTTYTHQIDMPELEPIKFPWGYLGKWDIANLMLYCGQSVQMDYGVDESGTGTGMIPDVLANIFGYSNKAKFIIRDDYGNEEWEDIIYKEMSGKRPVLYSGFSPSGNGHAFIVDGYESGRFHVDWGWDGMYNGHFLLTGLNPDNTMCSDLNHNQDAVIGIQPPNGDGEVTRPIAIVHEVYKGDTKYFWRQSDGIFPAFDIHAYVYGKSSSKEAIQFGWGLCNENGLIAVYGQDQHEIGPDFAEGGYSQDASITIDTNIADGDYTLIPVHRSNSSESWVADIPNISSHGFLNEYYTDLSIHDDVLALRFNYDSRGADYGAYSLVEVRKYIGIYTDTENGISYDLWEDFGIKRATVIPRPSGKYSGDLYIPDIVNCNGDDYVVYEADQSAFNICPDLKSLSTSMYVSPRVSSCPNLTKLELREGVSVFDGFIDYNPSLESLEFPLSLADFYTRIDPRGCDKLSSITFRTESQLMFYAYLDIGDFIPLKDIYFYSKYPPAFENNIDLNINSNATIHIPEGSLPVYQNTIWDNGKLTNDLSGETNNNVIWGYGLNNEKEEFNAFGIDCDGEFEVAIHVPSDQIMSYKNKKITGVQFYFYGGTMFCPDYAFITKSGTLDYLVKQKVTMSVGERGWCTIPLSEPYIITGDELYVGLGRKNICYVPYSNVNYTETDGCWGRVIEYCDGSYNGVWQNVYETQPDICHPLTLRFVIEGKDFPKDLRLCYPMLNDEKNPTKIAVKVVNRCTDLLTSYSVKWDLDGKYKGSKTIDTKLASGLAETIEIDIPSEMSGYQHTFTIDVVNVNGEEDAIPANSHLVYDFKTTATAHYSRKVVMEEGTGTWCGYSPRGIETIKQLYAQYPDNFIAIALHTGDEIEDDMLNPENYQDMLKNFPNVPSCFINRVDKYDPDLNIVKPIIEEQKDNADAMILANAIYTSEDCKSVKVKTSCTFGFTQEDNVNFRIAYVVTEDKVGPYGQANNWYGASEDEQFPYMTDWLGLGDLGMVEIEYNNVARGIYPDLNGMEGSVPTSVEKGKANEYEYTFDLPDNIQNKKNIRIVTLLIDNKTGEIMNADHSKVIVETDIIGDANNDEVVDIKDIESIVRYIMAGDIKKFNFKNADLNGDNKVNATDLVELNNLLAPKE